MKTIELRLNVDRVFATSNYWFVSLMGKQYCRVNIDEAIYFQGSIQGSVLHNGIGVYGLWTERVGYINENGMISEKLIDCIIDKSGNYKWQGIDNKSVIGEMFQIPKNKMGIAISKKDTNPLVVNVDGVFDGIFGGYINIQISPSADEKHLLLWRHGNSNIIIMDNPLQ